MDKLTKQDAEKFLSFGENNKPFLPTDYIREKVMIDYEAKKRINKNASILESLMNWICHELPYSDEHALAMQKFSRTAEEIWKSGKGNGCTEYALIFLTFARQLGFPTTLLQTVEENCLKQIKLGKVKKYVGHSFCECFIDNKWVLCDPTNRVVIEKYNLDKIETNYLIHNKSTYIPYLRTTELPKMSLKEHNDSMEHECLGLN